MRRATAPFVFTTVVYERNCRGPLGVKTIPFPPSIDFPALHKHHKLAWFMHILWHVTLWWVNIIGTHLSDTSDIGERQCRTCRILKTTPSPTKDTEVSAAVQSSIVPQASWDSWIYPPHSTCQKKVYSCGFVHSVGNYNSDFITILCCVTKITFFLSLGTSRHPDSTCLSPELPLWTQFRHSALISYLA